MRSWNRFWFSVTRRHSMGAFRVVLCAWFAFDFLEFLPSLDAVARRPEAFFDPCAGLRWFGLGSPAPWLGPLRIAAWILLAAAGLGAGTRVSLLGLAAVNWWLRGWHSSFVYVGHASILPAFALAVLAVAPGAASWSLDSLALWLRDRARGAARPLLDHLQGPPAAVWPVHLILALCGVIYLGAGIEKVRDGGLSWLSGRTLQWYLDGNAHQTRLGDSTQFFAARPDASAEARFRDPWALDKVCNSAPATAAGRRVAGSRAACAALSWATLLLQWSFIFVFFMPRRAQALLLASAAAFHGGIGLMMAIDFGGFVVLYLCAVDWNAIARRLDSFIPGVGPAREESSPAGN